MNPYKFFFAIEYCFFVFLCLFTLCSFIVFLLFLHGKQKRFWKKKTRENKFENKSKNASHKDVIWIKKNTKQSKYAVELDEFSWYNYIIFYRRRTVFCRLWLNSKTFTYTAFLIHANQATHAEISTYVTHDKLLWTHPTSIMI